MFCFIILSYCHVNLVIYKPSVASRTNKLQRNSWRVQLFLSLFKCVCLVECSTSYTWFIYHQVYMTIRQDNNKKYIESNSMLLHYSIPASLNIFTIALFSNSYLTGCHIPFANTRRMWLCCHGQHIFKFDHPSGVL